LLLTLGIAFGYAIPVPVDEKKLRNPKRDMILIAAAGPMANVALALFLALLLTATRGFAEDYPLWRATLHAGIVINFIMVIVNVIPVQPLDAAKAVAAIMPRIFMEPYRRAEPCGYPGIVMFFLMGPFISPWLGYSIDTSGYILIRPAYYLADGLLGILGAQ